MLNTTMKVENEELFVTLEGRLDNMTTTGFDKELSEALSGVKGLTLDFENLDYISSTGLRTLLSAQQYMEDNGYRSVKLINVNDTVRQTLKLTGFSGMLDVE